MKRRERRLLTLSGGLAATVLFACATASGTLAQSGGNSTSAGARTSALTAKALASPAQAIQRSSSPAALGNRPRIGAGDWCDGQTGGACWYYLTGDDGSALNTCDLYGSSGETSSGSGFFIADDGSYPAVGDTYWGLVTAGVSVWACTPLLASAEAILPSNVDFALDPSLAKKYGRIRCERYTYYSNTTTLEDFTGRSGSDAGVGFDCHDQPEQGGFGERLGYLPMLGSLSSYMITQFAFPIRSSKPSSVARNSNLRARVQITSNRTDDLFAQNGVLVRDSNLQVSARRAGSSIRATGRLTPASEVRSVLTKNHWIPGVMVKLTGRKGRKTRQLASKPVVVDAQGGFVASFRRPKRATRCQVIASYGGVKVARRNVGC